MSHLKEFDLLKHVPALRDDLQDNVALTLRGRKQFYLLPPGSVVAVQLVSSKFDRWAKLSVLGVDAPAQRIEAHGLAAPQVMDMDPGDALHVPRGWWNEVVNLETSVLLSGFFGSRRRTWGCWLQMGALQLAHNAGLWLRGH